MDIQYVVEGFQKVLKELGDLQAAKVQEYGIARYQETDEKASMLMVYSDVYRKYIRLRGQVLDHILHKDGRLDLAGIRESCRDIANYGGMGVQLIDSINNGWLQRSQPQEPLLPNALFGLEQIALVNTGAMEEALELMGATIWHRDLVTTRARVWGGEPTEQMAHLSFNYQLIPGKELELIRYEKGHNWLAKAQVTSGLSHLGVHVDNIEEATDRLHTSVKAEVAIAQDAVTLSHTNLNIKDKRRYRYRIFNTRRWLGFDLKFIQRHIITPGVNSVRWHGWEDEPWLQVDL